MANLTIQDLRKMSDEISSKKIENIKGYAEEALEILNRQNPDIELVREILQEIVSDKKRDEDLEKSLHQQDY
jgi:hypothetical protein